MAGEKNVKISWQDGTFDVKLENLSGKAEPCKVNGKELEMKTDGSPVIVRKNTKGDELKFVRVKNGVPMVNANGESEPLSNGYADSKGVLCQDIVPYYKTIDGDTIPAMKNEKTEVFEISKFEPLKNYTDKYIHDNFYQPKPAQGKSKSDAQRNMTIKANAGQMKKLYEYMKTEGVVGRGVLNPTSSGYLPTIAYIRAVDINTNGDWTLEVATFKQQKRFTWIGDAEMTKIVEQEQVAQNVPSIDEI